MPLGLASTLPLGNGRVLCSFKLNSTVRALVKLYDDVAEFNFLIEYLKLLQSVTNDRVRSSPQKFETIVCAPLHALSWPLVESQGDGVGRFSEIFYRLTADIYRQFKLSKNGAGPRLFIPFTFHSTCVPTKNPPLENQGIIIAYTASHHLSYNNALNTNVFRAVVREVYNQRSVSVPSRILPNSDNSLSENTSLISEPSEFSKSPWEALCEQQQAKSWNSTPSLVCEEEFPESTVGQTYDIYGPSPYEINTLNLCENEAVCHQPPVLMVCNISSLERLGEDVVANECLLIYESLHSLRCTEAKLVSGCQVEVVRTRISPSLFSNVGQNESHNSMLRPPGHRGSLSILEQRLCLKDLMSIATHVKLHNGETACEVPLPSASMRFVIKPTDIRKLANKDSRTVDQNQNTAEVAHHEGPLVMTSRLTAGDADHIELSVDLDVGLFLRKWLSKIGDPEMENLDVPRNKRSSLRRSILEHITESNKRHECTAEVPEMPLRRRSSRVSLNLARGLHQNDEDFRRSRDTLSGNQTRRGSECLRPWTSMPDEEAPLLPGEFSNDSTLFSNLIHHVSDGTAEVLVQSVDLLSSGSTLSVPLSEIAPRPSGGQNTSNECSRQAVEAETLRLTATCELSYLVPLLDPSVAVGRGQFTSISNVGDLKHLRQICKEAEVVAAGSPPHCESFDLEGPTEADPLSVSDREERLEVPVRSWTPIAHKEATTVTLQVDVEEADSLALPYEVCNLEARVYEYNFFLPATDPVPLSWSPPPVLTTSEAVLSIPAPDHKDKPQLTASAATVHHRKTLSTGPRQGRTAERQEDNRRRGLWVHSKSRTRKPDKEGDTEEAEKGKAQKSGRSRKSNFVALLSRFFLGADMCMSKPRRSAPEDSLTTNDTMGSSHELLPDDCQDGQWPSTPALQQNSASIQDISLSSANEKKQPGVKEESLSDQNSHIGASSTDETSGKEGPMNDVIPRKTSGLSSQQEETRASSSQTGETSDTSTVAEAGTYAESQSDSPNNRPHLPKIEPKSERQKSEVCARSYTRSVRRATLRRIEQELEVRSSSSSESNNSTGFASLQRQQQPRLPTWRSEQRGQRKLSSSSESSSSTSDASLIGNVNFMSREISKLKSAREIIDALEEELAHAYTPDVKAGNNGKSSRRERASTSSRRRHTRRQASGQVSKQSSSLNEYTPISIPMLQAPAVVSEADIIRSACPACRRTPESALSARNCQTNGSAFVGAGMPPVPRLLAPASSRGPPGFRPLQPGCRLPPVGYFQPMYPGGTGQSAYISPEHSWNCWGGWNMSEAHNN